jgi:hypothetical protein
MYIQYIYIQYKIIIYENYKIQFFLLKFKCNKLRKKIEREER